MANSIRWNKGSRLLLKGTLLILIGVALFSVINYSIIENTEDSDDQGLNAEANDVHLEKREVDDVDAPVINTGFKNPCYSKDGRSIRCIPYGHVIGIGSSGENLFHDALQMHEKVLKVDKKTENFFSRFSDIKNVDNKDVDDYTLSFQPLVNKIVRDPDNIIFIDKGDYLARKYDLPESDDHPFMNEDTVTGLFHHLDHNTKVFVMFRHPAYRLHAEYCRNGGNPDEFTDSVKLALDEYKKCRITFPASHCAYNKTLIINKVNIASSMYCYLWIQLTETIQDTDNIFYAFFEELTNPELINGIMYEAFNFLGLDPPTDPVIDFSSILVGGGEICNGIRMDPATKQLLNEYFYSCNQEMVHYTGNDAFQYGNNVA